MKKFILKILLFLAICVVLDAAVGYVSGNLRKESKRGLTRADEYVKSRMQADVVILGSSRALHHYVSPMMADSLGCSVYNAGMEGKGIIMNYGLLLEIISRYNPEVIIYEITPAFDYLRDDNERYLSRLRQAYGEVEGVDSIFWTVNPNERIKMLSQSYRVNSTVPHLLYDYLVSEEDTLGGYVPLWGVFDRNKQYETTDDSPEDIDPLKMQYIKRMVDLCKQHNIRLIFAVSPAIDDEQWSHDYARKMADDYDVPLIDFRDMNTSFEADSLYQDTYHLNHTGAQLYTEEVIKWLNEH